MPKRGERQAWKVWTDFPPHDRNPERSQFLSAYGSLGDADRAARNRALIGGTQDVLYLKGDGTWCLVFTYTKDNVRAAERNEERKRVHLNADILHWYQKQGVMPKVVTRPRKGWAPERTIWQPEQVAQDIDEESEAEAPAPAPSVAPGTEHLETHEIYVYTAKTGNKRPVRLLDRRMWRQTYGHDADDVWQDVTGRDSMVRESVNGATGIPVLWSSFPDGEAAVYLVGLDILDLPTDERDAASVLADLGTYNRPIVSMQLVDPARIGPTWVDYCKDQTPEPADEEPEPADEVTEEDHSKTLTIKGAEDWRPPKSALAMVIKTLEIHYYKHPTEQDNDRSTYVKVWGPTRQTNGFLDYDHPLSVGMWNLDAFPAWVAKKVDKHRPAGWEK